MNIIDRPTRDITGIEKHEELPGRKKILRIIQTEMPKIVCFIGKVAYEKYTGLKQFSKTNFPKCMTVIEIIGFIGSSLVIWDHVPQIFEYKEDVSAAMVEP